MLRFRNYVLIFAHLESFKRSLVFSQKCLNVNVKFHNITVIIQNHILNYQKIIYYTTKITNSTVSSKMPAKFKIY
jgi:hypothetical protein